MVEAAFEELFAEHADPLLDCTERANPATKNWSKENSQNKPNHHQRKRGLMEMLDKSAGSGILVDRNHAAKWTQGMQRGAGEEGYPSAAFDQGFVNGDECDQRKKEKLHHFTDPDAAWAKQANTFTKYCEHHFLRGSPGYSTGLHRLIGLIVIIICTGCANYM